MKTYNTIQYQNKNSRDSPETVNNFINNYFKALSIIYRYPYNFKYNSILEGIHLKYELIDNTKFVLNIEKGVLVLDSTLVHIEEDFELEILDISIDNYRYCNILFVVDFDFNKYILNPNSSNEPIYKLYLYDSITGKLHDPDNTFSKSKVIILKTFSIYWRRNTFVILPYRKRLTILDVYDRYNYIYENDKPDYVPKPYPNVENDNPDYTHDHLMLHNHCFNQDHNHNNNIDLINKYYSEKIKIENNTIPPPQNVKNNILSIMEEDILGFNYPKTLELFNKCNLELANIKNIVFDFRHIDPYQLLLDEHEKNKYNYSLIINYSKIDKNNIKIESLLYPYRTENYWLYLLKQYIDFYEWIYSLDKYSVLLEDNVSQCTWCLLPQED